MHNAWPDNSTYVEEGSALKATNREEFLENVDKLLNDKDTKDKLKSSQEKSIKIHAYKNDGKATERVVNIIKEQMKLI